MRRLTLLLSYLVSWQTFLYNYVTLRPGNWAPLPWRDLIPVAVGVGGGGGFIAVYFVFPLGGRAYKTPFMIFLGTRLRAGGGRSKFFFAKLFHEHHLWPRDPVGHGF